METQEITRAFNIGYVNGSTDGKENNRYKRQHKRIEYNLGFNAGMKERMKKSIKNKPQLFHNSVAKHNKRRMTIIVSGGVVQDVIRENIDCELVIHDYDIEGVDVESNENCRQDIYNEWYQEIHLA